MNRIIFSKSSSFVTMFTVKESAPPKDPEIVNSQNYDTVSRLKSRDHISNQPTNQHSLHIYLLLEEALEFPLGEVYVALPLPLL